MAYDQVTVDKVLKLNAQGYSPSRIAEIVEVSRWSVYRWISEYAGKAWRTAENRVSLEEQLELIETATKRAKENIF